MYKQFIRFAHTKQNYYFDIICMFVFSSIDVYLYWIYFKYFIKNYQPHYTNRFSQK